MARDACEWMSENENNAKRLQQQQQQSEHGMSKSVNHLVFIANRISKI